MECGAEIYLTMYEFKRSCDSSSSATIGSSYNFLNNFLAFHIINITVKC